MNGSHLLTPEDVAVSYAAIDAMDKAELSVPAMVQSLEHIVETQGIEGPLYSVLWALDWSRHWQGERRDLIERIADLGNELARPMASALLGRSRRVA